MTRRFYLENEHGQQFHFKYHSGVLLSNVIGLGFQLNMTYLKYGHIHKTVKRETPLTEISGVLNFMDGYQGYQRFIDYLNQGRDNFKLYYVSNDIKYVHVDVVSLSKTEIKDGLLSCEITLNKKSYWIKERQIIIDITEVFDGKVYPYPYAYTYQITQEGRTTIDVGGSFNANVIIEMEGSVDHPEINVIQNGILVSSLRLNLVEEYVKIRISSVADNKYLKMIKNDIETDIYAYQDFEKDNFIELKPGRNTLEFKSGVMADTLCKVHIFEYHLG